MPRDVNRELLELAEFHGEELEKIYPQWKYTADRMGLSDEDIAFAVDHYIPDNWEVQYKGIRMMIGAYLRETIDVVATPKMKEDGVKIVYGILPAIATNYTAIKHAGGDKVFVGFPDLLLVNVMNSFFHEAAPYFYRAEAEGFTYGCRHCPLNKMRFAAFSSGLIAAPDIIWSWGFNCDEGPKTDEMIKCLIGQDWNYVVSRIPHDTEFGIIDDEIEDRVKYLADMMKLGAQQVSDAIGIKVTDEAMAAAVKANNKYSFKIGQLVNMCCNADPAPLGGDALTMMQQPITLPFNTGFKYMEEALDVLIKEMRAAIKEGRGIVPKGAPKVGFYNVPFCIPWVGKMFRDNGVIISFSHVLTASKKQLSPSKYEDSWMQAAEMWLRMSIGQNLGSELEGIIEKIEMNHPDAMIMGFFDFDRWLGSHHKMLAKLLEDRMGIPSYYIEADFWDDRDYSPEALRTRIESVCQILKMKKGIVE
ncbi:2-hydroxyacyl-CoA dehydratase family protein [Cuneatibacter sp. NSJ-177]|uniref:2-hydroxyacyl-CoA dehydratase family protein n=1 Tax=Cuneatibacter sp. NSJ-177 TaxID=2931401 RepID=UPI001FD393BA|nr:2-hydroxyacyl-CoA dehydratase family protein [Cuneatibacter sp. NSJ-177]MCJ7836341.1 2-hydroxyacyl-CoA dehydratase family protein [Cuneatibacter sp. NSJ-177]